MQHLQVQQSCSSERLPKLDYSDNSVGANPYRLRRPNTRSMWLICVDAYSQFPFVVQMSFTTTVNTIAALSSIFAIEGYPKTMVSDNGPQLTADAFEEFCKRHGIKHITTAPFHPASNGLAERFVQTFTPNSYRKSCAELIHGRSIRTVISQLFEQPVEAKQSVTKYVAN
ncbi:uncharacterized protein K02A2.6-like [Drosophila biarmipes]|uniref:uncharacterized protein K02A2.6-like n=1 Tax=Drosophila biarmipes TaxID=125945 RepID=UPI0021CC881C|nr:uncharacterized protein K02A2.6-like [Drosophila biarmipes]